MLKKRFIIALQAILLLTPTLSMAAATTTIFELEGTYITSPNNIMRKTIPNLLTNEFGKIGYAYTPVADIQVCQIGIKTFTFSSNSDIDNDIRATGYINVSIYDNQTTGSTTPRNLDDGQRLLFATEAVSDIEDSTGFSGSFSTSPFDFHYIDTGTNCINLLANRDYGIILNSSATTTAYSNSYFYQMHCGDPSYPSANIANRTTCFSPPNTGTLPYDNTTMSQYKFDDAGWSLTAENIAISLIGFTGSDSSYFNYQGTLSTSTQPAAIDCTGISDSSLFGSLLKDSCVVFGKTLQFLFIPPQSTLDSVNDLIELVRNKPPLGYFYLMTAEIEKFSTTTTPAFTMPYELDDLIDDLFDPIKNFLGIAIVILGGVWAFNRIRHFDDI